MPSSSAPWVEPAASTGLGAPSQPGSRPVKFLDLRAINARHAGPLRAAFERTLASGWYILGQELATFEAAFARYCGVAHCVGLGNGLDALTLMLKACGIGPGHEVIVPANTYIATWLAITHVGATPVPVEPDEATHNLCPQRTARAITPRTRAVLAVHLYGLCADMARLTTLCTRHGLLLLEDAAQAHGASQHGLRAGALGDAAAFSFYPGKNLGALGDGGAVCTNNTALAAKLRRLRNYGSEQKYINQEPGYNSRLDELQAALLSAKLPTLDAENAHRQRLAETYLDELQGLPLGLPVVPEGCNPVWHLFVVRSAQRDALSRALRERGVETLIHYPVPPHLQQAYAGLRWLPGSLPLTERLAAEVLSLPMGPHLQRSDVQHVARCVREALSAI